MARVLPPLLARVAVLLEEWEEHPGLLGIQALAERLLTFPLSSPLMKLVTGLDLLLARLHDWEAYAAQHVSLRTHIDTLSGLVLRYPTISTPFLLSLSFSVSILSLISGC